MISFRSSSEYDGQYFPDASWYSSCAGVSEAVPETAEGLSDV